MGLAAPRKRTKISHDPNNTNWSRSTSGFGHKILSSQGWTPGSFLGARNAAHADMFTAASASHIRVVLKDDTMGLGAKSKRDLNEPTGLDAFKGLLGRLNGKSDVELAADQRKCEDVKLARYAASKWQAVQFVSGGLLAQEKPDLPKVHASKEVSNNAARQDTPKTSEKNRESLSSTSEEQRSKSERRQEKKERKEKKEKKEKREKKEKKGKKRKHAEDQFTEESDGFQTAGSETKISPSPPESASGVSSVTAVKVSRERRPMGRHVFRGRHIEQKKKALLDDKSLNEIFMVKS